MFKILFIIMVVNVVLKMAELVAWSWWFVFWPTWAALSFTVLVFGAAFFAELVKDSNE